MFANEIENCPFTDFFLHILKVFQKISPIWSTKMIPIIHQISTKRSSQFFEKILIALIITFAALQLIASFHSLYFDRDEVRKLLRTAGYTEEQFIQLTYNSKVLSVNQVVDQYQTPCNSCEIKPTIASLTSSKEHPPLYYILLQKWLLTIGSKLNPKVFSSLISIATIPAIYWLASELFKDRYSALISAALFSLSPYQFSVSQHISQYALWGFLSCLSTAFLLRFTDVNPKTKSRKIQLVTAYTVINVMGLYTHLFYGLLIFTHSVYLYIVRSWRMLKLQLISFLTSLLFLVPWILGIIVNFDRFRETSRIDLVSSDASSKNLLSNLLTGFTFLTQMFWRKSNISLLNNDFIESPIIIFISIISLIALSYFLFKKTLRIQTCLLVLLGLYLTSLPLMLLGDVLDHALASKVRYYLPAVILVFTGLSFLISEQLKRSDKRKYFGAFLLTLIILTSTASTTNLFLKVMSNKSQGVQLGPGYERAASAINASDRPLVISQEEYVKVLMLSHRLKTTTDLILMPNSENFADAIALQKERYKEL